MARPTKGEIEEFVRNICEEGDLNVLTKKLIREKYQAHFQLSSVVREEKDVIGKVLDTIVQELAARKKRESEKKEEAASSSEDDKPLKKKQKIKDSGDEEEEDIDDDDDYDDATPIKPKGRSKKRPAASISSDSDGDSDDEPLRKPAALSSEQSYDDATVSDDDDDGDGATPVKPKVSRKRKAIADSSDEDEEPLRKKPDSRPASDSSSDDDKPLKPGRKSSQAESDLDTSDLSSGNENDHPSTPPKRSGPNVKTTKRKAQPKEKTKSKASKKSKKSPSDKEGGSSYLTRLRQICRAVGIFVRNDVHFAGCTTDAEKIERLKEALKNVGMEGQPSMSKVDEVNLMREARALDASNIIETSGRPRRQGKDAPSQKSSPGLASDIKETFSRIRNLVSDSESD